uniref:Uncharacterized protein n=1 Tax=Oryza brachyantha TaxID=4533 RepID=J3M1M0_ORYBR
MHWLLVNCDRLINRSTGSSRTHACSVQLDLHLLRDRQAKAAATAADMAEINLTIMCPSQLEYTGAVRTAPWFLL